MSKEQEIGRFGSDWDLIRLNVQREYAGGPLSVTPTFRRKNHDSEVTLVGVRDYSLVEALLDAESVVITQELDCQREFGAYRVQCLDEASSEFLFDEFRSTS